MIRITITLEEAIGVDRKEASSEIVSSVWNTLEQPHLQKLVCDIQMSSELGDNPEFYPKSSEFRKLLKPVAKTEANSCQLRYLGGAWVITGSAGDVVRHSIVDVINYINEYQLYITNETIMTPEYARQLWYKRKN